MLVQLVVILLGAIVGIAQVAAIRRLLSRRADDDRSLASLLIFGGVALFALTMLARWLTDVVIGGWLAFAITMTASSAILIGIALLEANKQRS